MNTDKIYAEQLANEYALKDTSKVVALRKLDKKVKLPATVFTYTFGINSRCGNVPFNEDHRQWYDCVDSIADVVNVIQRCVKRRREET